jgi:tellurite resistance protein
MADWRKLAVAVLLADGKIDDNEVKVLKKELWADGKIDEDERKFLIELRNTAQKKAKAKKEEVNPAFERLFFQAIEEHVLQDGKISAAETKWLESMLLADGKIDANEKKFLKALDKKAKHKDPAFEAMYAKFKNK